VYPGPYVLSMRQPELDLLARTLGVSHVRLAPVSLDVEAGKDVVQDLVVSSEP